MKFEAFWQIIEQKNPLLASGKITMTSENFRKALELSFNQGVLDQKEEKSVKDNLGYGAGSLFGDIFGKGFGK